MISVTVTWDLPEGQSWLGEWSEVESDGSGIRAPKDFGFIVGFRVYRVYRVYGVYDLGDCIGLRIRSFRKLKILNP